MFIKQFILLVVCSVIAAFLLAEYAQVLGWFHSGYSAVYEAVSGLFSSNRTGTVLSQVVSFTVVSLIFGAIVGFVGWIAKRNFSPYWMYGMWVGWLILTTMIAL